MNKASRKLQEGPNFRRKQNFKLFKKFWGDFLERLEKLQKIFSNIDDSAKEVIFPMLDDVAFIENQLEELKKFPFIEISSRNPARQRQTAAAKQYKELMQQYNACIKTLLTALRRNGGEETSPLEEYLKGLQHDSEN